MTRLTALLAACIASGLMVSCVSTLPVLFQPDPPLEEWGPAWFVLDEAPTQWVRL